MNEEEKKKAQAAKKEAEEAREDKDWWKTKFRKFRHKNAEHPLSISFGQISKGNKANKKAELEKLLTSYMDLSKPGVGENVVNSSTSTRETERTDMETEIHYAVICREWGLDFKEEAASEKIRGIG